MNKLSLYSAKGVKGQGVSLPKDFSEKENLLLLAQAIRVYESEKHPGLSKTKTRAEVAISKAKIWRQKGTGRARHGARSAPIFVGGGTTFGPKGVKRRLALPKKMRKIALKIALSQKANLGKLVIVKDLSSLKKTKEAANLLNKIARNEKYKEGVKFTLGLANESNQARLVFRNLKNASVVRFSDLNAYSVYFGGIIVIDKEALETKKSK